MYINSSKVGMESARKYTTVSKKTMGFTAFMTKGKPADEHNGSLRDLLQGGLKEKEVPDKGKLIKSTDDNLRDRFSQVRATSNPRLDKIEESLRKIRESCVQYLIELFFGMEKEGNLSEQENVGEQGEVPMLSFSSVQESYYKETESTSFSTTGKVITADGRELEFNLDLEMSRSFEAYYKTETKWQQPVFTDPLVINLDTNIASVSDQKFFFDLDADGKTEEISMLNEDSGYLALDKNEDGVINDGSELFGTKSGNGFADLAKYDTDKDGWIDEDDEIFNKLKIWTKDKDGNDILYTLKEKGIGAICLQNAATDFSLKDEQNKTNAAIRNTGIFLYESGMAGSVQHLDLVR